MSNAAPPTPPPAPRSIVGRFFRTLGGLLLLAIAVFFLYFDLSGFGHYFTRPERRSAEGKIIDSGVKGERGGGRVKMWSYTPQVNYEFTVDGKSYKKTQVGFWMHLQGSRAVADQVVRRFPSGSSVKVWYDPANPEDAVIDTDFKVQPLLRVILCLGLAFLTLRIIFNNLAREAYATSTKNLLFTRKYTRVDITVIVVSAVLFLPMAFNLIWFE